MWKKILGFGTPKQEKDLVALYDRVPQEKRPRHIAVIMDGNGRWAQKRGLPRSAGHKAGAESFRRLGTYCKELGIDYLTVYAFSTENWRRPPEEVRTIMSIFDKYMKEALSIMERDKFKMRFFGERSGLSPELQRLMAAAEEKSTHYDGPTRWYSATPSSR